MLTKIKKLQPVRTLDVVALLLFAYAAIDAALNGEYIQALALTTTIAAWSLYLEATSARGVQRTVERDRVEEGKRWHERGYHIFRSTTYVPIDGTGNQAGASTTVQPAIDCKCLNKEKPSE